MLSRTDDGEFFTLREAESNTTPLTPTAAERLRSTAQIIAKRFMGVGRGRARLRQTGGNTQRKSNAATVRHIGSQSLLT